jgi:hypothetical protein
MKNAYQHIKNKILTDDTTASVVEYMLSKAIAEGISTTVKFIYKNHKIIKNKRRYYSIYRLEDGKKLYGKIKYQDIAKYIIDNLDETSKINRIIELEANVSRFQDKIDFMKKQLVVFRDTNVLEVKLERTLDYYRYFKRQLLTTLGKHNIC